MKFKTITFGILSLAFFTVSFSAQAQDQKQDKQAPNPEKQMERLDTDQNGTVSLDEFKSSKRKNDVDPERLEKNFSKMDSDSNGELSLEELQAQPKGKSKKPE
ncbi:EF-hand domain-containing protein [Formosa sp. PL04]|uniref:EF-hand domain-containing protein n=1 Tax=Formosa sp. PL04 TaxID=3081755 RepID=UPI0029827F8E|nr:EF-hand domain-containing protein [Formosa sp. PL04]MDW5289482.1 EF-hand domain-containing protein [Formosa sp. PL04]